MPWRVQNCVYFCHMYKAALIFFTESHLCVSCIIAPERVAQVSSSLVLAGPQVKAHSHTSETDTCEGHWSRDLPELSMNVWNKECAQSTHLMRGDETDQTACRISCAVQVCACVGFDCISLHQKYKCTRKERVSCCVRIQTCIHRFTDIFARRARLKHRSAMALTGSSAWVDHARLWWRAWHRCSPQSGETAEHRQALTWAAGSSDLRDTRRFDHFDSIFFRSALSWDAESFDPQIETHVKRCRDIQCTSRSVLELQCSFKRVHLKVFSPTNAESAKAIQCDRSAFPCFTGLLPFWRCRDEKEARRPKFFVKNASTECHHLHRIRGQKETVSAWYLKRNKKECRDYDPLYRAP